MQGIRVMLFNPYKGLEMFFFYLENGGGKIAGPLVNFMDYNRIVWILKIYKCQSLLIFHLLIYISINLKHNVNIVNT